MKSGADKMDLMALMTSRIDQILDNVGPGMKVLLMDSDTTTSVSLSCPQSRIMKKEVFLFEILHSRVASMSSLNYLKCVVLIRPTTENLRLLAKEVTSPRYGSYHIFFTNRVKRADLKSLAEADGNEVVADLKEVPSDFMVFESHVFTTKIPVPIVNLKWNKAHSSLTRCADSLKSLLVALKATRVNICYCKESIVAEELAQAIQDEVEHDGNREATLVLLDRRMDPITPLLNQWTYQAMIHELIGMTNNTVDLQGRDEIPEEMKKVSLGTESDEFYKLNMYANFGEIGQTIQNLVKNFQDKVKGHQKLDSINDIKDFITSYPDFKKMSGTVSKHVTLVGELSKEVKNNGLLDVSELEQNIACGSESDLLSNLLQVLNNPTLRTKDALRLVALFSIRFQDAERHLDKLCKGVKGVSRKDVYEVIQTMTKYSRIKSKYLFDEKSTPFNAATGFFKGLKGAENVYTQHQPLITKDLLPDIIRGRTRPDFKYLKPAEPCGKVIVFVIGGITYEETRAVSMFNKDNASNVVIGGTSILNYDSFMHSVNEACCISSNTAC